MANAHGATQFSGPHTAAHSSSTQQTQQPSSPAAPYPGKQPASARTVRPCRCRKRCRRCILQFSRPASRLDVVVQCNRLAAGSCC